MFEDRAKDERDRLSSATGLPGIVVSAEEGGSTVYRVIIGKFASRRAAEQKAAELADSSVVPQAQVVSRPK